VSLVSRVVGRSWQLRRSPFVGNLIALGGSLASVAVATLLVARVGGPYAVGQYALLRILPWLVAIIVSSGLPYAISYFLAGPTRGDRRVPSTILAMTLLASVTAMAVWAVASPLLRPLFFRDLSTVLVAWAGLKVGSRLVVITAKAASQGSDDLAGSNVGILLEELSFLPIYLVLTMLHGGYGAIIGSLVLADVFTGAVVWLRLARRGFFRGLGRPSLELGRRIAAFGFRSQIGNMMTLLNLRLDFVLVDILVGTAALGTYSIASKYAELVRLPPIAANWVLYPRFAKDDPAKAVHRAKRMILRLGLLTAFSCLPLLPASGLIIPRLYGHSFEGAILPAQILFLGLMGEGVGAVINAFLYGRGRPGLASIASGSALMVTLVLDLLLIPRLGSVGAAITSSIAYLTTDALLVAFFLLMSRPGRLLPKLEPIFPDLPALPPSRLRRAVDMVVAAAVLLVSWPLLLLLALAVRISARGSAIFKQERVGEGGVPFVCYKFRSMRPVAGGPGVTAAGDPRITRLGRILRATSLDELPQLLNVLQGDMTLVGPRPESIELARRYPPSLREIFAYRPGLTGLTQVHMRENLPPGLEDVERHYLEEMVPWRVATDLEYLDDPSLGRTIGVMAETVDHVIEHGRVRLTQERHRFRAGADPGKGPRSAAVSGGSQGRATP